MPEDNHSLSSRSPSPPGYEALSRGTAFTTSRQSGWLRLTGADRLRFVNGLVTCDLRSLVAGQGVYGFFPDAKGKVVADGVFLASETELFIAVPEGHAAAIAGHMSKYLVADQVEIEELESWKTVLVAGSAADHDLVEVLGRLELDPWNGALRETEAGEFLIHRDRRLGVSAWALGGSDEALAAVIEGLEQAGVQSVGADAVAAVRIEQSVPWFGLDYGPAVGDGGGGNFPQETGIEDWAVSFEKGCYLGQEVIARIHFRGKVNRSLRGLVFDPGTDSGDGPGTGPSGGVELTWQGEVVGALGSTAYSPSLERAIGLSIVHHKAEPGSELATPSGPCRLIELPFDAGSRGDSG